MRSSNSTLTIEGILSYYHDKFHEHYALAVTESQEIPDQVNNEIRSALTHIARANEIPSNSILTGNDKAKDKEIEKAKGHIDRASRDCLKIVAVSYNKTLRKLRKEYVDIRGHLPEEIKKEIKNCRKLYTKIIREEAKGTAQVLIISSYENLVSFQDSIIDKLEHELAALNSSGWNKPFWKKLMGGIFIFMSGVLVNLICNYISDGKIPPSFLKICDFLGLK